MNNDEKVKEMLEKEPVPQELEPENIKAMLDEKAPQKKRSGISVAGRVTAAAAAIAVITGGSYAYFSGAKPKRNINTDSPVSIAETTTVPEVEQTAELFSQQAYMSGAKDYTQIYELMKHYSENESRKYKTTVTNSARTFGAKSDIAEYGAVEDYLDNDMAVSEEAESEADESYADLSPDAEFSAEKQDAEVTGEIPAAAEENAAASYNEGETGMGGGEEEQLEFSDTHNQEQDVLEADIAKTDGKFIYYISNTSNGMNTPVLRSAEVKDGKFLSAHSTSVKIESFYENADHNGNYVEDMYLYNDMIVIIGDTFADWYDGDENYDNYHSRQVTYAAFYTTGESPELIDVYYQDGYYNDVRIAPDGNMYLVTNYSSEPFDIIKTPEEYENYIPQCGLSKKCGLIPPEDILLPSEDDERTVSYVNYSVIGSVDLNESGNPKAVDTKALADYTGQLYASPNSFYTATVHGQQSDITRIAIGNGGIAPAASATIDGYVKDQFSMSEYGGYFRAAVTRDIYSEGKKPRWWERMTGDYVYDGGSYKRDNALYVFDLDMNMVGSVEGFGDTESIKSVSFQGDMAYVVTYEQTDPLFAIDLSDPASPTILDEFKINGYSTYMQQWTDGLLLGFGVNADEHAIETGIKMVMFDNSDPENLKEVGFWSLDREENEHSYSWVSSQAVWERKALLIAPEKNLIGFPVECQVCENDEWKYENKYMFFSYEDGQFIEKGTINADNEDYFDELMLNRAMYIGDYVYVLSGARFIAADINSFDITDDLRFSEGDREKEITTTATDVTTTEEATTVTTTTEAVTTEETTTEAVTETSVTAETNSAITTSETVTTAFE